MLINDSDGKQNEMLFSHLINIKHILIPVYKAHSYSRRTLFIHTRIISFSQSQKWVRLCYQILGALVLFNVRKWFWNLMELFNWGGWHSAKTALYFYPGLQL